jgi:DNA-binding transcriptional LysR family regulator
MGLSRPREQTPAKSQLHRTPITTRDKCPTTRLDVELRQLRYFVTVAEENGFNRAAERLHIVQPAVSQQIRRLERELGVRLFHRSTRHVALTAAGERLLTEARATLAAADRIGEVAAALATGADTVLRLGTSQGLGDRLNQVLAGLGAPVRLHALPVSDRLSAVRNGELDAAFVRVLETAPGLELLPLWTERLVAAVPAGHPLAAEAELSLRQLSGLPARLAPRPENPPFHDLMTKAGITLTYASPFTNLQDTLAEIGAGQSAWTVLYAAAAKTAPVHGVAYRPLTSPEVSTSLAVPLGPPPPSIGRLIAVCKSIP